MQYDDKFKYTNCVSCKHIDVAFLKDLKQRKKRITLLMFDKYRFTLKYFAVKLLNIFLVV